jgi:hypothetical protein
MKLRLLLALVLVPALSSCPGMGPLARIDVHSDAAVDATTNLKAYGVVTDGTGYARITMAADPFLPIYPDISFVGSTVLIGHFHGEDGPSWAGSREDPIPFEFQAIARTLWHPIRMGEMGLVFLPAPAPQPQAAP